MWIFAWSSSTFISCSMLLFQVFHGLLLLGTVQDNAYPEKRENTFKLIGKFRNISSHSYRSLTSHYSSDLTEIQPNITYSEEENFVFTNSAMKSYLLQQPLILNASPTWTSKVMLPAIPLEIMLFWQIFKCTRCSLIRLKPNCNALKQLILILISKQFCKLGFNGTTLTIFNTLKKNNPAA